MRNHFLQIRLHRCHSSVIWSLVTFEPETAKDTGYQDLLI